MTIKLPVRLAAVGLVVALTACGGDDGAGVRDLGGSASGSGSGSATASGTGSGTGLASGIACEPVGDPATAEDRLDVTLNEWSVETDEEMVSAGLVQFVAFNQGDEPHELVIVRGEDPGSLPVADDGTVDEDAVPAGAFVGEIEAFPAGTSCSGVFELKRGEYVLFCNILETEGDEAESHFAKGMRTTISVR
jgi:hypothetical protein